MKKVAVLGGGGLMGHGIPLACLQRPETDVILVSSRHAGYRGAPSLKPGSRGGWYEFPGVSRREPS